MAKISVIMGVYNCKNKDLLLKSVNSIINQTFEDWEFLICNDGSSDSTLSILYEVAKLDGRIKILSYNTNHGLAYALNYCLKHAKGEYIARQDDDDFSLPERFERQVDFLDKNMEYDLVGSNADVYNDSGIWGEFIVDEKPNEKTFFWNNPFIHPVIMIRKNSIDKINGYRVAKETRRCEDYDMFMRLYSKKMKGYNIQEKLYLYRIENDSKKCYRPMKYRIDEAVVRFKGYKKMGVLLRGFPYILKPILIGLIPQRLFYHIKKKQY